MPPTGVPTRIWPPPFFMGFPPLLTIKIQRPVPERNKTSRGIQPRIGRPESLRGNISQGGRPESLPGTFRGGAQRALRESVGSIPWGQTERGIT